MPDLLADVNSAVNLPVCQSQFQDAFAGGETDVGRLAGGINQQRTGMGCAGQGNRAGAGLIAGIKNRDRVAAAVQHISKVAMQRDAARILSNRQHGNPLIRSRVAHRDRVLVRIDNP